MSVIAELDTSLQALLVLKAPGVTKSRISSITTLCVENVKSESGIVQKIYTHFRRAPATHKLGVLYVIDAVTRQWIDKAGQSGHEISASSPQDGTFAAGVQKISQLLPQMMTDLISNAPYDQKFHCTTALGIDCPKRWTLVNDKITKLVDIWERGNIFSSAMTAEFKGKLEARKPDGGEIQQEVKPTDNVAASSQPGASAAPPQIQPQASNILASLNLPQTGSAAPPPLPAQVSNGATYGYPPQPANGGPSSLGNATAILQTATQGQQGPAGMTSDQANQLSAVIPPHIQNDPAALQRHISLLQQLVQLNVPPDQWMTVIAALDQQGANTTQSTQAPPMPAQAPPPFQQPQQQVYNSPARNRSRSPVRRRDSPIYGDYQGNEAYRQRSPGRSATPSMQSDMIPLGEPKWTAHDDSLPAGHIRVLSRTLFVGGTTCGEPELRHVFEPFGQVQTCIPNPDKRHAFVKYTNRAGAEAARDAMQNITDGNLQSLIRSVRWGVGFGPRDCNDYTSGVSVIPIDRLTDADRKWVLTAPHGGSGGKAIESGLVMEEPDIEIGAGVSSKAISRRVGGAETFRRGGRGNNDRFGGRNGNNNNSDRGYNNQRRSSPNRMQPNSTPQQGWQPPSDMPQYGLPPAPAPAPFYGMPPNQGYYG